METCKWYDVGCQFGWLVDEVKALVLWIYDSILIGLAYAVEAIPVPDFLLNVTPINVSGSVAFFASAFQLEVGLAIVVSAYTARFVLRRIPVIG